MVKNRKQRFRGDLMNMYDVFRSYQFATVYTGLKRTIKGQEPVLYLENCYNRQLPEVLFLKRTCIQRPFKSVQKLYTNKIFQKRTPGVTLEKSWQN